MNSKNPGEKLTKGFLNRIWNQISTKLYERKFNRTKYLNKNWENIKWKIRSGRFVYFICFYYTLKYFLVDKVFENKNIKIEEMRKILLEKLNNIEFIEKNYNDNNSNKSDITFNNDNINEAFKKINMINENLFIIKKLQVDNFDKISIEENNKNNFKKLNDLQKCKILNDIYFSLYKYIDDNNCNNKNGFRKLIFYKVDKFLSNKDFNNEPEESKIFIRYK
jgi:hypothetical protein